MAENAFKVGDVVKRVSGDVYFYGHRGMVFTITEVGINPQGTYYVGAAPAHGGTFEEDLSLIKRSTPDLVESPYKKWRV